MLSEHSGESGLSAADVSGDTYMHDCQSIFVKIKADLVTGRPKRSAKLVIIRGLYKDVGLRKSGHSVNLYSLMLEQESGVDVECAVSVLLVEAACILERHDEVLVHDEAEACAGCCMKAVLA